MRCMASAISGAMVSWRIFCETRTALVAAMLSVMTRESMGEAATRAQIHATAAEPRSLSAELSERQSLSSHRELKPLRTFDKRLLLAPVALAAIVLGGFFGYRYFTSSTGQINSIAVLPFENSSGNAAAT